MSAVTANHEPRHAEEEVVVDMNVESANAGGNQACQKGSSDEDKEFGKQRNEAPSASDAIATVPPAALEWKSVSFSVPRKTNNPSEGNEPEPLRILNNVSGMARPGELVAILGSSGAGKTTMLNVVSGRVRPTEGELLVNGTPVSQNFNNIAAYVQQEDLFLSSLTVKEHLSYQASLRLGRSVSEKEKSDRVDSLISALGLKKCQHSLIGSPTEKRGISGGERKRLALASEIITNPSILFADEPTSGLDSHMAESVVGILQKLARSGRTVIATIHQPSSAVYHLFDKLVLMREGEIVFFGPKDDAVNYFAQIDKSLECPTYTNPADFFIRTLATDSSADPQYNVVSHLGEIWRKSDTNEALMNSQRHAALPKDALVVSQEDDVHNVRKYAVGRVEQTKLLLSRSFKDSSRNPVLTYARLFQTIILGLLSGAIFFRLGYDQESIRGRNGATFFIMINQAMLGLFGVLQTFPLEKPIFLREHSASSYSVLSYYIAKMVADVPFQVAFPFLFSCITFWMMELGNEFATFAAFTGIVVLTTNAAMSLGYLISASVPNVSVGLAVGPVVMLPLLLTGGFFTTAAAIPDWLIWIEAVSFFKYGYEAAGSLLWDGVSLSCEENRPQCLSTGEDVLEQSFEEIGMATNVVVLISMIIGFRLLTYLALRHLAYKNTNRSS
eukprot:gb/GECG01009799.1/.p1 GENE.gb/GECG01009799.1/~~gb/GECG01009799.1/.p1  ORF type:complete len:671 (+),score=86.86 gb/GECG01009799.1/:1-2013(+)